MAETKAEQKTKAENEEVDMGGAKGMVVKMGGAKEQEDTKVKMTGNKLERKANH
jgi:hypothetical protein